jgi:hypothetical protein
MIYGLHTSDVTATVVTLTEDCTSADNTIVIRSALSDPLQQFLAAMRRATREAKERNEEALSSARTGLRTLRDDPGVRVPLPKRSTARRRRLVAGRVCGGSNRYRVMLG